MKEKKDKKVVFSSTASEFSSEESSSSSSSSASSDEAMPAPSKKAKCLKPHQQLAKKAAKKGDDESPKKLKQLRKRARRADSDKVPDFEEQLQKMEKLIDDWKKNEVEDHVVQRFVARMFRKLRTLNYIPCVDYALFKKEIGYFRLVEMDMAGTLDMTGPTNREKIKATAGRLLDQVVDGELADRLQQTWEGNAWILRSKSSNEMMNGTSDAGMFFFLIFANKSCYGNNFLFRGNRRDKFRRENGEIKPFIGSSFR